MSSSGLLIKRRWIAPEIVQISTMDCGPAALACVLEGFRIPVNYPRLREACQTDVDGTSIDALEVVANQLGLDAAQVMVPPEHLFLSDAQVLPAIVVVHHADRATHFVVVWRRLGNYMQVMDPAIGRRWVSCQRFAQEVFRHELNVPAQEWRQWAGTDEFLRPLRQQMAAVGVTGIQAQNLIARASSDGLWFGPAALDASVRFVKSVVDAGGLSAGRQSAQLTATLFDQTRQSTGDVFKVIPKAYWSAHADTLNAAGDMELKLQGAVLLRIRSKQTEKRQESRQEKRQHTSTEAQGVAQRSPELAAALAEKPPGPFATLWTFLKQDGLLSPAALSAAMVIAAAVVTIELLLFRGLFDITTVLTLPSQRLWAMVGLLALVAMIMLVEVPIASETMRLGRHLEVRLRMALLEKLPHLSDRYFQSRPVSDMADRSHSIQMMRIVPGIGLHLVQVVCDLCFTLLGIILIDPQVLGWAAVIVLTALILPLLVQPFLNERDLRVRNHGSALNVFYLDALLGLVPIRTHRAERAVRRLHEGLLVQWARSKRGFNAVSVSAGSAQSLVCVSLAALALYGHFMRSGTASGADLLLIFWMFKLPSLGSTFAAMATQYPMQRNVLLRLLEPLSAPTEAATLVADVADVAANAKKPPQSKAASLMPVAGTQEITSLVTPEHPNGTSLQITKGAVLAAGHILLLDINLTISPGEHVAIVGSSGAGKSTLIGLILGWHRLVTGQLQVDGAAPTAMSQERMRHETAWVDPAIQLWNRSFLDNLMYAADDMRFESINEVLESADLRQVLQKLPEGLQTLLGESGALLSGGEGQRLRLARAFMQTHVRLALLDEPFRGLDRTQRGKLLVQVRRWWQDATLLCVTHDVAETRAFDRVLVIEHGRIVEDGPPAQLAATDSRYRELLDAETKLQERIWAGPQWRHIRAEGGRISEGSRIDALTSELPRLKDGASVPQTEAAAG
jgi:ABC-type bacteriocin/lantibiotic exporter with double-glycine peptidase domain